ncbi:MAG: ribonuclease HII [Kiritimatiellaeota bacterium]|nr:ribonuclease HII [Kiritimatiellota bacterium]
MREDSDRAQRVPDLFALERAAWREFGPRVAGVDEVGRGPLAGPVVAVAFILPGPGAPAGVTDSKALRPAERERLAELLERMPGAAYGIGQCSAAEIDAGDILSCTHAAMRAALLALEPLPDSALVDGRPVPGLPVPSRAVVGGDRRSASIAAASIVAKVYRDRIMVEMDRCYPGYGFARHKGYGTREHLECLARLGPCPIHRRSFGPVARLLAQGPEQLELGLPPPG